MIRHNRKPLSNTTNSLLLLHLKLLPLKLQPLLTKRLQNWLKQLQHPHQNHHLQNLELLLNLIKNRNLKRCHNNKFKKLSQSQSKKFSSNHHPIQSKRMSQFLYRKNKKKSPKQPPKRSYRQSNFQLTKNQLKRRLSMTPLLLRKPSLYKKLKILNPYNWKNNPSNRSKKNQSQSKRSQLNRLRIK